MVIPKPGKADYSKARAHRVISLLDTLGKLVERTAAHLIAEQLELKRRLHDGQYGSRVRRSTVDAVACLMNFAQQAWGKKEVAGALMMDIKSAFNNVSRSHLAARMMRLGVDPQLVRWTLSFMEDRHIIVELDGKPGEARHGLDSGIPQGSPASPVLFAVYIAEMFSEVEEKMDGQIKALSFVDDVAWLASGKDAQQVQATMEAAAGFAMDWVARNAVAFDTEKTDAVWLRSPLRWRAREASRSGTRR